MRWSPPAPWRSVNTSSPNKPTMSPLPLVFFFDELEGPSHYKPVRVTVEGRIVLVPDWF